MDLDTARRLAEHHGLILMSEDRVQYGTQLRFARGAVLTVYDSGKCVKGGKGADLLDPVLAGKNAKPVALPVNRVSATSRKVFVVCGRDADKKADVEAMLRRWGLQPLVLDQLPSGGQTIIETLENVRKEANYAVVLATPDDQGHRKHRVGEKLFRASQTVVLELGMMLAIFGRKRVAILLPSTVEMEKPSDIPGLIYIPYKDKLQEAGLILAKEINAQGITIDLRKV